MWSSYLSTLFACKNIKMGEMKKRRVCCLIEKHHHHEANGTREAKNVTISHSKLPDAFPHILKGKCLFTLQLLDGCNLSKRSSFPHPCCPDFYYTHLGQRHVRVIHYIQEIRLLPVLPAFIKYSKTKINVILKPAHCGKFQWLVTLIPRPLNQIKSFNPDKIKRFLPSRRTK